MSGCAPPEPFLPLQQSTVYAAAAAGLGARIRWLEFGADRVLAVERGRLRLVLRCPGPELGPELEPQDRCRALRRLARWPGVTVATPEGPVAGFGLIPLVTPLHHAVWALGPDLRAGMAGKWRNRLVAGDRAGLRLRQGDAGTLDRLLMAEAGQRRSRGYRALSPGFSQALPATALRLWEWRHGGTMAAAMAFVVHGTTATYHLGWGSDVARTAGVHPVMLTRAAEALWREGVRWLDLGSVDTEAAPGLARFKLGTGAALKRLGATVLVLP